MINIKFLNSGERKEILEKLNNQFGIKTIPWNLIRFGKERIMIFSGKLDEKSIEKISDRVSYIDGLGLYFGKFDDKTGEIRLSIEATQLLKDQITKNIFDLIDSQAEEWMKGQDLQLSTGRKGFLVMKYKNDFLGTGKASQDKIGNFIPKERRLKSKLA